jgi:hypothetical protein
MFIPVRRVQGLSMFGYIGYPLINNIIGIEGEEGGQYRYAGPRRRP